MNTVVCDENRTKQAFLKRYETVKEKPWLTKYKIFLLFDFVPILKNIRNVWLREKRGELVFEDNDVREPTKWCHLITLSVGFKNIIIPLSANPEKWSNTLKQIVGNLPTICLSVFDHFINLALKGLKMPKLSEVSLVPKPIERQKVSTCYHA